MNDGRAEHGLEARLIETHKRTSRADILHLRGDQPSLIAIVVFVISSIETSHHIVRETYIRNTERVVEAFLERRVELERQKVSYGIIRPRKVGLWFEVFVRAALDFKGRVIKN